MKCNVDPYIVMLQYVKKGVTNLLLEDGKDTTNSVATVGNKCYKGLL